MKYKNKLIYNLGRRGFFSEINNMILAMIYAERNQLDFIVNSYYWNCKYKNGLRDYFDNEIIEENNILSAQMTRNKPQITLKIDSFHHLFYDLTYIMNSIYSLMHGNVLFGVDIYEKLRSATFLSSIDTSEYLRKLNKCLHLKASVLDDFILSFERLGIDKSFVGVHIRRGDKITTGEMNDISLDKYIKEIIQSQFKAVYIATDDISSINYIKDKLISKGISLYYNPSLEGEGFNEGNFNHNSRRKRYEDTLTLLFDIYVLSKASCFIGTYSSNLSRVIPCFLGFENCKSLDEKWHIG